MSHAFMMISYKYNYWLADDGRIYSGPAQGVVLPDDAGYVAFLARAGVPTRWPEDPTGAQTDEALEEVIGIEGLSLTWKGALKKYSAKVRTAREGDSIDFHGKNVSINAESQSRLAVALAYAEQEPDATIYWKAEDGFLELTKDGLSELAKIVGKQSQELWAKEAKVSEKIDAGSITTNEQIDAEF